MNQNLNLNLKLDLDFKTLLPQLRKAQPYIFGAVLIGVFGFTAYTINAALNVKPATVPAAANAVSASSITFDKKTISTLKTLQVVQGSVPTGDLGKSDPFK